MVGFVSALLFASVFLNGQAILTDDLKGATLMFVTDSSSNPAPDSTIYHFEKLAFKAEVYLQNSADRPIRNLTLCNSTFVSYTAILWPSKTKPGVWGHYLDYGEAERMFRGNAPYAYSVHRERGRSLNIYDKRDQYHARFTVGFTLEVNYSLYKPTIQNTLTLPLRPLPSP